MVQSSNLKCICLVFINLFLVKANYFSFSKDISVKKLSSKENPKYIIQLSYMHDSYTIIYFTCRIKCLKMRSTNYNKRFNASDFVLLIGVSTNLKFSDRFH